MQAAERGDGYGAHVRLGVVQMAEQGRDGRRADRRQHERQLIALLPRQRRGTAQRQQQRLDGHTPLDGVQPRGVRLEQALQVVEPLDDLFEDFSRR